ncbi:MAG: hypothetical protein FAF05_06380 [Epsilonproteobacteria bacterium]|nr:hypothetical protein [Campylobacterota bacterium]
MQKKIVILLLPVLLLGERLYESRYSKANKKAMQNPKIKCRTVCDKKIYRQQEISEAINFYRNAKEYKFNTKGN